MGALAVVSPIGLLAVLTVAAQIGEVDFATDQENGGKQAQQKLLLGFAKCPIWANRACRIDVIATSWVFDLVICTLQTEVAFCLATAFLAQIFSLKKLSELLL